LALFSGCANKPVLHKPLPVVNQDRIETINQNFDLYVLNKFHSIDNFKQKVDLKLLNLQKTPNQQINNSFIYYK